MNIESKISNSEEIVSKRPFRLAPPTLKFGDEKQFSPWSSLQSPDIPKSTPETSSTNEQQLFQDSGSNSTDQFSVMRDSNVAKVDEVSSDISDERSSNSMSDYREEKPNVVSSVKDCCFYFDYRDGKLNAVSSVKDDSFHFADSICSEKTNSSSNETSVTKRLKLESGILESRQLSLNAQATDFKKLNSTDSMKEASADKSINFDGSNKAQDTALQNSDPNNASSFNFSSPFTSTNLFGSSFNQSSSAGGFVFGENLHERVVADKHETSSNDSEKLPETFEEAVQKLSQSENSEKTTVAKSLSQSAMECEAARQNKRKFDEISVISGEENECNVLQMNCKLFVFENSKANWIERGRGVLRLNDQQNEQEIIHSRIIVRAQGSLRVMLNTKVRPDMTIEQPSPKTVRFSAVDAEGVGIYLVVTQPKSAEDLFIALDSRILKQKQEQKRQ